MENEKWRNGNFDKVRQEDNRSLRSIFVTLECKRRVLIKNRVCFHYSLACRAF